MQKADHGIKGHQNMHVLDYKTRIIYSPRKRFHFGGKCRQQRDDSNNDNHDNNNNTFVWITVSQQHFFFPIFCCDLFCIGALPPIFIENRTNCIFFPLKRWLFSVRCQSSSVAKQIKLYSGKASRGHYTRYS